MRSLRLALSLSSLVSLAACGDDDHPSQPDAGAPQCEASEATGARHAQTLVLGDGVEDRTYFLYVPAAYRCDEPIALLVDFHGTAGGPAPEEAYAQEDLLALAEREHVIVARLRSRSRPFGGEPLYQWDSNAGDLARNATFARNLVAELARRFAIDPARIYASGFSSGANMTAQFLGDPASPFTGLAPIAGGSWAPGLALPDLASGPRLYLATGYRDYLWPSARELAADARAKGLPADRLFVRRFGGGHDVHRWEIDEAWAFLDRGERPAEGALAAGWTREQLPEPADVNALALDGATLVAAGASGHVWRRGGESWTVDDARAGVDHAALCFRGARGLAGGASAAIRHDATGWTPATAVPDFGGMLGAGWINGVDCRPDGSILAVGYWSSAISTDGGGTWAKLAMPTEYGVDAQLAGAATAPGGATVVAGYYFIGRVPAGMTTGARTEFPDGWATGVAAVAGGRFWVVGDHGHIWASTDDGATWTAQTSGTDEDLYAVDFVDAQHGAAVGRAGTVLVTTDGGATWTRRALGLSTTLAAVHLDATTLWIAGEDGLVARAPR